jgi:hypothetical protein
MKRFIGALATALAVVASPHFAAAQDGKRPERPNPETLFSRLDANHDGAITKDEIPAAMPERLKLLLREADKDHNGKIAKRELIAAINARHHGPGAEGRGPHGGPPAHAGPGVKVPPGMAKGACPMTKAGPMGKGPARPMAKAICPMPKGPACPLAKAVCPLPKGPACPMGKGPGPMGQRPGPVPAGTLVVNGNLIINGGTVIINGGTLVVGGPAAALKGAAVQGRPMGQPKGRVAASPVLNARVIFNRLDGNKDGKLSFDEFAVGVRHLQQSLATRIGQIKQPLWDRARSLHQKMGQFRGQFGHPGMGPMGQHPGMGMGMGPMGQQPGMGMGRGPMGQRPGMGMGMGPMGQHPGMGMGMGPMGGHRGMGPKGQQPGMGPMGPPPGTGPKGMAFGGHQGPEVGKVRVFVTTSSDGVKKAGVCGKCGAKTPETCTCGKKREPPRHEVKKCETGKPAVGHQSIEARLTALERQQAEMLKMLRSIAKPDHRGEGRR